MEIKNINVGDIIPKELFFNGKPYKGDASFINGYNGYTSTDDDGLLCAIVNSSCFGTDKPNLLTDKDGKCIKAIHLRSNIIHVTFKRYNIMYNVGKVKYLVNYHNGISKHEDVSDFFDIATFTNKEKFNIFITSLQTKGFIESNII